MSQPKNLELFAVAEAPATRAHSHKPLANRLRPQTWEAFYGLESLDRPLLNQLRSGRGRPPSLILWGPPGSGKTTLAKLIGHSFQARFVEFSAVLGGVKEVREIVAEAKSLGGSTILFVDEIHRFNKGQQDAFLPHVEDGTIILIGATTENPSFYLTSALLSRARVLVLPGLSAQSLGAILQAAEQELQLNFEPQARALLVERAGADARRLLNFIESFAQSLNFNSDQENRTVSKDRLTEFLKDSGSLVYDRSGEEHYNVVSAFIKSMRGSNPDAALYWGFRMIESGEDPRFVIRRMMIFASEDIGNADPRALQIAVATSEAFDKLGLPEGKIPIAQCITYLASAPKSNRSYQGMHAAIAAIKHNPTSDVPVHLRNAPTGLMKSLGYGEDYQYPHEYDGAVAPGVSYLPKNLQGQIFYSPSDRGYEKMIAERLALVRSASKK